MAAGNAPTWRAVKWAALSIWQINMYIYLFRTCTAGLSFQGQSSFYLYFILSDFLLESCPLDLFHSVIDFLASALEFSSVKAKVINIKNDSFIISFGFVQTFLEVWPLFSGKKTL